jgi:hypothetical protein
MPSSILYSPRGSRHPHLTMTMPTFLIIGAAKAGTTSLYRYVSQHPDVFMSQLKEPCFFAVEPEPRRPNLLARWLASRTGRSPLELPAVADLESYRALFAGARSARAIGEASTAYLHVEQAAERIRGMLPDVKLVALLRDPADRAYSSYRMMRLYGLEPCVTFSDATAAALRTGGWRRSVYLERGLYWRQLRRYYDRFAPEQIRIYLHDDLRRDPQGVLCDLFRLIGVDDRFPVDFTVNYNTGGVPRSPGWHAALHRLALLKPLLQPLVPVPLRPTVVAALERLQAAGTEKPSPMPPALRYSLVEYYRADIARLEELLGRSLESWLDGRRSGYEGRPAPGHT